jgi:hypothetical protein
VLQALNQTSCYSLHQRAFVRIVHLTPVPRRIAAARFLEMFDASSLFVIDVHVAAGDTCRTS